MCADMRRHAPIRGEGLISLGATNPPPCRALLPSERLAPVLGDQGDEDRKELAELQAARSKPTRSYTADCLTCDPRSL